jgi:hypothetical protein
VRRAARVVVKNWWCSFGYDYVLDAIRARLHEVIASILFSLFQPDYYNYFNAFLGAEGERGSNG